MNKIYTIEDTNPMSWDEFGKIMEKLVGKIELFVKNNNILFDAIAPILRNGAIPGTIIANKLGVTTLLPIQVKYDYQINKPVQLLPFLKPFKTKVRENANILVTECNTFSGESAKMAAKIILHTYPGANLIYATVTRVYREPQIDLPIYKRYFIGTTTNENFEANEESEKKLNLRGGITIYPWETAEFELKDINDYFSN